MSCTKYMKVNMTDLVYIKKDTVGPVYQQTTTKKSMSPHPTQPQVYMYPCPVLDVYQLRDLCAWIPRPCC